MRNLLVAVNTRLTCIQSSLIHSGRAPILLHIVKTLVIMAIPALSRIRGFHSGPFILGKLQTFGIKFFTRTNGPKRFMQQLIGRLYLSNDLV